MEAKKSKLHYGFVVAAAVFLLQLPMVFILNTNSIFYTPIMDELGASLTQAGLTMTIMTMTMAFAVPVMRRLFNKYDTRITLTAVLVVEAVCFVSHAMAGSIIQIYAGCVLLGICCAVELHLVIPILMNNWFAKKTATMIGICGAAQGLFGMIFSTVGAMIIDSACYRACYLVWAAIVVVVGVPLSLFVVRYKPEDKGLLPYGYDAQAAQNTTEVKMAGIEAGKARHIWIYILLVLMPGLDSMGCSVNFYLNSYYVSIGITTVMAGVLTSVQAFGNMFGKITGGALCDKNMKAALVYCVLLGAAGLAAIVLFGSSGIWVVYIGAFVFGIAYGTCNTYFPALTRYVFGPKDFAILWPSIAMIEAGMSSVSSFFWGPIAENFGFRNTILIAAVTLASVAILGFVTLANAKKYQEQWTD